MYSYQLQCCRSWWEKFQCSFFLLLCLQANQRSLSQTTQRWSSKLRRRSACAARSEVSPIPGSSGPPLMERYVTLLDWPQLLQRCGFECQQFDEFGVSETLFSWCQTWCDNNITDPIYMCMTSIKCVERVPVLLIILVVWISFLSFFVYLPIYHLNMCFTFQLSIKNVLKMTEVRLIAVISGQHIVRQT